MLRIVDNISQEELAEKVGISRQTLSKYETGESLPDIEKTKAILNLIHISDGEILYFGKNFRENEAEIKEQIGYAGGAVDM